MMKTSSFAERLRQVMNEYGLKRADIVKRTGLHKSTISYYLSGKREPARDNIFIIAKALNVNPVWLMGLDTSKEIQPDKDVNIDVTYGDITIELINKVKKDEQLKRLITYYLLLSDRQQSDLANLIEGMVDKDNP